MLVAHDVLHRDLVTLFAMTRVLIALQLNSQELEGEEIRSF